MKSAFKGRSLLTLNDVSDEEMAYLINLAVDLKANKKAGKKGDSLTGKNIALVFEKSSTRTRCATAVAISDEGGSAEYLSSRDIHLGKKESIADTARVLGRMFDGLMFRGFKQLTVELLAKYSGIPVWNGLTDEYHPTQALADLMTVQEKFGELKGVKLVYIGDGRNNVANSLMLGCAKMGVDFVNCTPEELFPEQDLVDAAAAKAAEHGSSITVTPDPSEALPGANVVATDVWISMGEESKREERINLLRPYQVNSELMSLTGNVDDGSVMFLHCLPAFHDSYTEVTKDTGPLEVTNDVFESSLSKVFDQAENKMHTIRALLVSSAGR
ncbi:ornithine carbamoyltransferase [bacterium B17]|nr:ornithine carbamoyltransferase [bacterium B17]